MNKKTFLKTAAALGLACGLVAPVSAQMQGVIAPGTIIPGTALTKGTITYSNQTGTRDSFSVGMSTNMGANTTASSTADYAASGSAVFQLNGAGTTGQLSTLKQEIGNSRSSESSFSQLQSYQQTASSSAATSASNTAASSTDVTSKWGTATSKLNGAGLAVSNDAASSWETNRNNSSEYKAAYSNAYSSAYESAYSNAASAASGSGIISGQFIKNEGKTVQTQASSGSSEITTDVKNQANTTASAITTSAYDSTYSVYNARPATGIGSKSASITTEAEYTAAKSNAYNSAYSAAVNTLAKGSITSTIEQTNPTTNDVTVKGVGSATNLSAASTTKFESAIIRPATLSTVGAALGSGTASSSAGGSLSTSSYADANSTKFTSSFVQAY